MEIIGIEYKGMNKYGDFNWMINRIEYSDALFLFNDNEEYHNTSRQGRGNAIIRKYNKHNLSQDKPHSAGIPTGTLKNKGYTILDHKTKKVIDECLGGVLFIDEAYSLALNTDKDSYSQECIDTLCEALSDSKDNLMVIVAGYENEMNNLFFKANRGLESRFIWRFKIENYTAQELLQIYKKKVNDYEWIIDLGTESFLEKWFQNKKEDFMHFGRDMEILFLYTKICHARRIYGKPDELRKKITIVDLDAGYKMFIKNTAKKETIKYPHMYL